MCLTDRPKRQYFIRLVSDHSGPDNNGSGMIRRSCIDVAGGTHKQQTNGQGRPDLRRQFLFISLLAREAPNLLIYRTWIIRRWWLCPRSLSPLSARNKNKFCLSSTGQWHSGDELAKLLSARFMRSTIGSYQNLGIFQWHRKYTGR